MVYFRTPWNKEALRSLMREEISRERTAERYRHYSLRREYEFVRRIRKGIEDKIGRNYDFVN